jgi:hypothetical protein
MAYIYKTGQSNFNVTLYPHKPLEAKRKPSRRNPIKTEAELRAKLAEDERAEAELRRQEKEFYDETYNEAYAEMISEGKTPDAADSLATQIANAAIVPSEVVVISTRKNKYSQRNLLETIDYDEVNTLADDLEGNEGFAPMVLTDAITVISVSKMLEPPYESLSLTLTLNPTELHRLTAGVANYASISASDGKSDTRFIRNLCTGAWVTLSQKTKGLVEGEHSFPNMAFLGKITNVNISMMMDEDGLPIYTINMTALSFYQPLFTNEIKQTLSRDKSISDITPSAVFKSADFSYGFLKALLNDFSLKPDIPVADLLAQVCDALMEYQVPLKSGLRLKDIIQVVNGSAEDMNKLHLAGSDADVILGKLLTSYQGYAANNMTHDSVIRQMFQPLPTMMELIATCVPYNNNMTLTANAAEVLKELGVVPVIIYRYRPAYPLAPPTSKGLETLHANMSRNKKLFRETRSESFFGDMPTINLETDLAFPTNAKDTVTVSGAEARNQYHWDKPIRLVAKEQISGFQYAADDGQHINYVFCENAFSNGQAQNFNYARNHVRPVLNKRDINRSGLRPLSVHAPFLARGTDEAEMRKRNLAAAEATAERLFHTIGMGHQFVSGTITIIGSLDYMPVGTWMVVPDMLDGANFCAYVIGVNTVMVGDNVREVNTTITFDRGHYGVQAPLFDAEELIRPEVDINLNLLKTLNGDRRLS